MRRRTVLIALVIATDVLLCGRRSAAQEEDVLTFDGEAPLDGPDHFLIPFTVPEGIVEIEVVHDDTLEDNILDWGLNDQHGWRGWGGGTTEPAIVGIDAASRGYVPGEIDAGEWAVVVGMAKIAVRPAPYHVEVTLRREATLAPQPEREPYVPSPPLESDPRWYAGDFHLHSRESTDATPTLDEIAVFAEGRSLDFVAVTDHNTVTAQDFFNAAQAEHPHLLFIPGFEFTTYDGHANAIGGTEWVDHKIGMPGVTIEGAVEAIRDQGAIFSINHPVLELLDLCLGCAWHHDVSPELIDAVEIGMGGWAQAGRYFDEDAIDFWDALCDQGAHVAALGGSDDHRAGQAEGGFQSPIGSPTTMVFADELSVEAILDAIRAGRTVVKLQDMDDPMVELVSSDAPEGDTVTCESATLVARVTGGEGSTVRFVHDGVPLDPVEIDADPFEHSIEVTPPDEGETRWRAEVVVDGRPRTVTSHLWFRYGEEPPEQPTFEAGGGCGATGVGPRATGLWLLLVVGALAYLWRRSTGGHGIES